MKLPQLNPSRQSRLLEISWLIWALATLFVIYEFLLDTTFGLIANKVSTTLTLSVSEMGLLSATFFLSYALMQVPAGFLLDRSSARWVLSIALATATAGVLIFAMAPDATFAILGRGLMGLGSAFGFVSAGCLTARYFPIAWFAVIFGLTQAVTTLSAAVGQDWVAHALTVMSWRSLLFGFVVAGAVLTAFIFALIPGDKPVVENKNHKHISIWQGVREMGSCGQLWLAALYGGLKFGTVLAFASLWDIQLQRSMRLDLVQASSLNAMIFIGIAAGSPILSWVSKVWGRRLLPIQLSTALLLITMMLLFYIPYQFASLTLTQILMFLLGFFSAASMLSYAVGRENLPSHLSGAGVGFINTFVFVFSGLLQIIPAWILHHLPVSHGTSNFWSTVTGFFHALHTSAPAQTTNADPIHFQAALLILPICLVVALIATFFIRETYCQSISLQH